MHTDHTVTNDQVANDDEQWPSRHVDGMTDICENITFLR